MVEAIAIIGVAATVANIIDIASKTIKSLHDLHNRWCDADFTLPNLIAQLTALRAALSKIHSWIGRTEEVAGQHHQLAMDMDLSMTCVRMLIRKMGVEAEGLRRRLDENGNGGGVGKLDLGSKIKVVFGGKGTGQDWQGLIERQVSALTLLLAAYHCNTISDQKVLLEKSSSREVFKRVEDDTASLYFRRDTASIYGRCMDTLLKISMVYNFGYDLFITNVYERALRASLKAILRRQQANSESSKMLALSPLKKQEIKEQKRRSESIDRQLGEDMRRLRLEVNVLLMGDHDEQELLMKQMKIIYQNGYTVDELRVYRLSVKQTLIAAMSAVTEYIQEKHPELLEKEDMNNVGILTQELKKIQPAGDQISQPVVSAMARLWKSQSFSEYFTRHLSNEPYLRDSASYFFNEIERIGEPDYIPTEADILRARLPRNGIQETRFKIGQLAICMSRVGRLHSERRKWIYHFENRRSIVFIVDLCCYDEFLHEDTTQNRMMEALVQFDAVVNSRWFMRTSVILLLTNFNRFKQKLGKVPLSNCFPEYTGGNDVNRAAKHLVRRFNEVNRASLSLHPHLVEMTDTSNVQSVVADIAKTIWPCKCNLLD